MRWRALWSIVGVVVLLGSGAAEAKNFNHLLRGDYAFSGEATCLVARGGFGTNFTPISPPFPFVISFSIQGVRIFNGDGTGTLTARTVAISHPSVNPNLSFSLGGANSSDLQGTFTYEVEPDLTFTVHSLTLNGTVLTGASTGQTFTIPSLPAFSGGISRDHRTLTLAHEEPTVETVTFSGGDVQHRICHRARILLELKEGK